METGHASSLDHIPVVVHGTEDNTPSTATSFIPASESTELLSQGNERHGPGYSDSKTCLILSNPTPITLHEDGGVRLAGGYPREDSESSVALSEVPPVYRRYQ